MSKATWVTHGMMRAMCQAHRKEGDKCEWGRELVERNKKNKERKEREKGKGKRKKMRKRKVGELLPQIFGGPTIGTRQIKK